MYYVFAIITALHQRVEDAKDRGATATEYAMLVAFIAVAIVAAVTLFGGNLAHFFHDLSDKIGITRDTTPTGTGS